MCGIFGWIIGCESDISRKKYILGIEKLLCLSETRGKEASGICVQTESDISIVKAGIRATKLIHTSEFNSIKENIKKTDSPYVFTMGHARMVTNGDSKNANNNQPVTRNDLVGIHNGIIVNDQAVWSKYPTMKRKYEVDTEVLLALMEYNHYADNLVDVFLKCLAEIEGSVSIALTERKSRNILLYTNIGSLYYVYSNDKKQFLFASERYIIEKLICDQKIDSWFDIHEIVKLNPRHGLLVNVENCVNYPFSFNEKNGLFCKMDIERKMSLKTIGELTPRIAEYNAGRYEEIERKLTIDENRIKMLKRCSKCLLPETFPGITYDEAGVCSVCNSYKRKQMKSEQKLETILQKTTGKNEYDCIVPLSGGRDSCYLLHYLVKELHLRPVAFTYDWGMVTDLARRNIQRMCSELEVEHILISADITKKRKNICLNVNAWLKKPSLATIPLFMEEINIFFIMHNY